MFISELIYQVIVIGCLSFLYTGINKEWNPLHTLVIGLVVSLLWR